MRRDVFFMVKPFSIRRTGVVSEFFGRQRLGVPGRLWGGIVQAASPTCCWDKTSRSLERARCNRLRTEASVMS